MTDYERVSVAGFRTPTYRYIRSTDRLPSISAVLAEPDALIRIHLFNPDGAGDWWIAGYDPDSRVAYGAARIHEFEIGDFGMSDLLKIRTRFGLPIERDLYWTPIRMSELIARHDQ